MAKSKSKASSKLKTEKPNDKTEKQSEKLFFNFSFTSWIESAKIQFENKSTTGSHQVATAANHFAKVIFVKEENFEAASKMLGRELSAKQIHFAKKSPLEFLEFHGNKGPFWLIKMATAKTVAHRGLIRPNSETKIREFFGQVLRGAIGFSLARLEILFINSSGEEMRQALLGLELASYRFTQEYFAKEKKLPKLAIFDLNLNRKPGTRILNKNISNESLKEIAREAKAINLARHLVNLPPNILNPKTYADEVEKCFTGMPHLSIDIWKDDRLKKENMNLLRAVGQGAEEGPRLIHLKYRPKESSLKPIAFVGKGITFDTGGLDIKPSSGMRLMKKDMGGSAAVLALCYWASATNYAQPLDFYLAVAENAVDEKSFRPSDVIVARNSTSVEIHNTDAEGRLVLADALDVAVKQQGANEPTAVINVATLTGAIKVGLGTEVAGLFCNNDVLSESLFEAGRTQNDLCWPMPLFQNYRNQLRSQFADMSNCSDSGFGGAISAALFLESFVAEKPWAHLDIFAWKEGPLGAFSESGGSGQGVLMLTQFLRKYAIGERVV